jgi:hypothetical protein
MPVAVAHVAVLPVYFVPHLRVGGANELPHTLFKVLQASVPATHEDKVKA